MAAGKHSHHVIDQFVNEHPAVAIKNRASTMRGKYHYRAAETIPQYEARLAAQVPWKSGQPIPGGASQQPKHALGPAKPLSQVFGAYIVPPADGSSPFGL